MDSNKNLCRICLTTNVFFNWTEYIFEFSGPTYKECYYQYTHLQQQDLYTQMICLDCGNALRNAYLLVEKALASDLILRNHKPELKAENSLPFEKEQVISIDMSDSYNLEIALASDLKLKKEKSNIKTDNLLKLEKEHVIEADMEDSFNTTIEGKNEQFNILTETAVSNTTADKELLDVDNSIIQKSHSDFEFEVNGSTIKPKKKIKKLTLMCSFCSRIFTSKKCLDNHERTHERNRERTETCTICGVKFLCKNSLRSHMEIHNDSRERKHKCEFCPKAFFACGALNVHKRIHLGQMIKCDFCSKEYCRQIDLDRHMKSHNVTPLTSDTVIVKQDRRKCYRECDICGDKVNSDNWKHHKAKHLNQYTKQCMVCSKKFFPKASIRNHLRNVHGINSEYDKYFMKLDNKFEPRLTHLMKEQNILKVYTEK